MIELRKASPKDAPQIAKIMQDWLDETPWVPDLHTLEETVNFCENRLIGTYETTIAGDAPLGFISIEPDNSIAALYVSPTGQGTGSALLTHAQKTRSNLSLWVFQNNTDAIRFYTNRGFKEVRRTNGDNAEKLPDILMGWHQ